jgi:hypothetical protein
MLSYDDALAVIRRLIEVAAQRGEPISGPIVLLGGTALAAWHIREHSNDVDLYMPRVPDAAVAAVEDELRATFGPTFRIDVTSGENVWGSILVRDISASPRVGAVGEHELRALRVEDLFVLKLAVGRPRDRDDLELLAPHTTADAVIARWNELVVWHGDRRSILGFADAFVREVVRLFGGTSRGVIDRLNVTEEQRESLREAHDPG